MWGLLRNFYDAAPLLSLEKAFLKKSLQLA